MMATSPVIAFDVNGTLLDVRALGPVLKRILGGRRSVDEWMGQLVLYSMATTATGSYRDFGEIAVAVTRMIAAADGRKANSGQLGELRKRMRDLPAFPEVSRSLGRLRKAGFRLIALSNSGRASLEQQLRNAGIRNHFELCLSVEMAGRFKPAGEVYRAAAARAGVRTGEMLMVAAHPWDLMGAAAAGCRTAFLKRPGHALFPAATAPDYVAADLADLAKSLTAGRAGNRGKARFLAPLLAAAAMIGMRLIRRNRHQVDIDLR